MPRCSLCTVATLISSAVISILECLCMIVLHWWLSIYLVFLSHMSCLMIVSHGYIQIANLSINSCGPGLYSILLFYWWINNSILCILCDRLATSFLIIVTSSLVICYDTDLIGKAVSDGIFLGHGVCLGLLFLLLL